MVVAKQQMSDNIWADIENGTLTLTDETEGNGDDQDAICQLIALDENALSAVLRYVITAKGFDPFMDANGMIKLSPDGCKIARELLNGKVICVDDLGSSLRIAQLLVRMR
jgi:hypothetical protein